MKLFNIIFTELFRPLIHRDPVILPLSYNGMSLIKDLKPGSHFPFAVGLYQDSSGHKFVGKFWTGKFKNVYYYLLRHEIIVLKTLNTIQTNHSAALKKYRTHTAEYYSGSIENRQITLFTKYISGKELSAVDTRLQVKAHQTAQKYLTTLGSLASSKEISTIGTKSASIFSYQFPLILVTAITRQPWLLIYLPRVIKHFLQGLPYLYTRPSKFVLTHGDLDGKNVLIHKAKIYILDVEQTVFTYVGYDQITCVHSPYFSDSLNNLLYEKIVTNAHASVAGLRRTKSLVINHSIHCLTGILTSKQVSRYRSFLLFGITLK